MARHGDDKLLLSDVSKDEKWMHVNNLPANGFD